MSNEMVWRGRLDAGIVILEDREARELSESGRFVDCEGLKRGRQQEGGWTMTTSATMPWMAIVSFDSRSLSARTLEILTFRGNHNSPF